MKKYLLLLIAQMFLLSNVIAQEIGEGIDIPTPPPPAKVSPEQRWLYEKGLRETMDFMAENYTPQQLIELAKAMEFIDKRRALSEVGRGEKGKIDYKPIPVDVNNPESVKNFINAKFKRKVDEAVKNTEVLNTEKVNVE